MSHNISQKRRWFWVRNLTMLSLVLALAAAGTVVLAVMTGVHPTGGVASATALSHAAGSSALVASSVPAAVAESEPSDQTAYSSAQTSRAVSSAASVSKAAQTASSVTSSEKPVWVSVSIPKQRLYVYGADGSLVKECVCSTGTPGDDTPTGTFHVSAHGKSFFSEKYQEGGYYWVKFYGNYWIHSIPFDKDRNIIPAEAEKLGEKASHGCVRISIENAKWMYENIPMGTKVVVQ